MKYFCIHGHFYQPPRENPKTGKIDVQPSAQPFPNWNYRINAECYRPNTNSPIIGESGEVLLNVNNYSYISFNFGPTLLRWLKEADLETHDQIIKADQQSVEKYGAGTALAQVYHHAILPLCNARDKKTEILWGIADFEYRFGRSPDGMWLAETAVDIETLEALAAAGIKFTLLAPKQAHQIAKVGSEEWQYVDEGTLDTTKPYRVELPSGRTISLFFYHGGLAHSVAFSGALDNGENFAYQIREIVAGCDENGIIHFATDGESYGHHHRYGDMALAYCLKTLEEFEELSLCNYASYLKEHPPQYKVRIHPVSAWSCAHGVGRWSENCGCVIDPRESGKQQWRVTVRDSLNWLRDELAELYERSVSPYCLNPWTLRDQWQHAILHDEIEALLTREAPLITDEQSRYLKRWIEVQRCCLMMFTSCGWFFDDPAGLECVQILRYAKRALELLSKIEETEPLFQVETYPDWTRQNEEINGASGYANSLEKEFVRRLSTMISSTKKCTGETIWTEMV